MRTIMFFLLLGTGVLQPALQADLIPTTSEQLAEYMKESQQRVQKSVADFVSIPEEKKNIENTLRPWSRLGNGILTDFRLLYFLKNSDFPCKTDADQMIQAHQKFLYGVIVQNLPLYHSLVSFVKGCSNQSLSRYDQYQISAL